MRVRRELCVAIGFMAIVCTGCGGRASGEVDDARLRDAAADTANWLTYGRTYSEQRHSPLSQINTQTVSQLRLAWSVDLGTRRGVEGTPLVDNGILYATSSWSVLHAVDASNGRRLWTYDPKVPKGHAKFACCDVVNRGPALYRGMVIWGTLDGRLVAVTADSGRIAWEVQTTPAGTAYTITGAPRIVNGLVLIGNGGAEYGVRGFVSAYDAKSGTLKWRTYTVPGDPSRPFESEALRRAATTWTGEWWKAGGGGTAWDAIVYDPESDLIFVGTGNGSPWYRRLRSPKGGDNLYLSSIIALRAADGEMVWHYQTTPGDNWDYTATQPLMLAELPIDGRIRKVIMQAPKNGYFYVIDRLTGEFISGTPYAKLNWSSGLDSAGRPIENSAARELQRPMLVWPTDHGAHNWHPMAFNPSTGLVYFPVLNAPLGHAVDTTWRYTPSDQNIGMAEWPASLAKEWLGTPREGFLLAWDPVQRAERWRHRTQTPLSSGVLSTAGNLVFHGDGSGKLRALRATDGQPMWESEAGTGIAAPPITYAVGSTQFVVVATGWGGPERLFNTPNAVGRVGEGRILAFALDGAAQLPAPDSTSPLRVTRPTFAVRASPADVRAGATIFGRYCARCHGDAAVSGGVVPDLRRTSTATHEQFAEIVLGGVRDPLGMPSFAADLQPSQVIQLQAYILARARQDARKP